MLSNWRIKMEMKNGNIVIDPFIAEHLGTNSYDVRLGEWLVRQNPVYFSSLNAGVVEYNSRRGAKMMWQEPERIRKDGLIINPGETVLAHTEEVIGGQNCITTEMRAKSTVARFGVSVCKCAGLGDVGFISRWTMEMTNHGYRPVSFQVGDRISQILFHNTGQVTSSYGKLTGRYGQGVWTPEDMLPKGQK